MSCNRLFIYDPETNKAVVIAKGFSTGWMCAVDEETVNVFFDEAVEFTGGISKSRFRLITEPEIPDSCEVRFGDKVVV